VLYFFNKFIQQEFLMSVRATERLVGDVVIATGLPNSALMVVQSIDENTKMVNTTWFSDNHECQEGVFPASSLDRHEAPKASTKAKKTAKVTAKGKKSGK
jgi:hypothetical protein